MRVSSVTGTLFGPPVLETMLVLMPPTMIAIRWPALNTCSFGIVGNCSRYGARRDRVSAASGNHSESRFCESRMPRVTRQDVTSCVGLTGSG